MMMSMIRMRLAFDLENFFELKHTISLIIYRINLKMEYESAAKIVALRPALEALMVRITNNPEGIQNPGPQEETLMSAVRSLSRPRTGRFNLSSEADAEYDKLLF